MYSFCIFLVSIHYEKADNHRFAGSTAVPVAAQELFTEELAQPQPKEQKWTIRGSAGYYPTVPTVALPFIALSIGLANNNNETEKTDITFPPFCQVEALYSFNPRWSAGLAVGYSGFEMIKKDKATGEIKGRSYFTLLPKGLQLNNGYTSSMADSVAKTTVFPGGVCKRKCIAGHWEADWVAKSSGVAISSGGTKPEGGAKPEGVAR